MSTDLYVTIQNLDLAAVKELFVTVKGYNEAGLYITATSNGVFISRISAGLVPLGRSYVYDGRKETDL